MFPPPFGLVVIVKGKEEALTIKSWAITIMIRSGDVRGGSAGEGRLTSADPRTPFASASFSRVQPALTGPAGPSGPFVHSQVTSLGEVGGPFTSGPK